MQRKGQENLAADIWEELIIGGEDRLGLIKDM